MRGHVYMAVQQHIARVVPSAFRRLTASVRARSTIAATVVILVGALAGSFLLLFLLQRALISTVEENATTRAAAVANLVSRSDLDAVRKDVVRNTTESQLVQVLDADGKVIASSSVRAGSLPLTSLRPPAGAVRFEKRNALYFLHSKDPYLITSLGVSGGGSTFTVVVAASNAPQNETIERLLTYLLAFVPAAALLVAAGTWTLVGRALRPVESIRARVAEIRSGRLTERVPVPTSHDEMARLAITMNEMLDRLAAGQRLQRSFVADASHELRSPLATLAASLDVMGEDPSPDRWRDTRVVMESEVERMSRLVDNLLLLAKANDDGRKLVREDVDLDDILDEEVRRLRGRDDVTVSTSIIPVRVLGDRGSLSQVVRNIIENAAVASQGQVRVSVTESREEAVLSVEDDGVGIPVSERDRVFERFVRLDPSRSRDSGGSGLGLAIVREVVISHGGSVEISQSTLGGARFDVRLPLDHLI